MKTLAAIRAGYAEDLISRSADVCIKEKRPLVLGARETPLRVIYLENMLALARLGVGIFPAVPAFYMRPKGLEDVVDHSVGRMMDYFGIESDEFMPGGEKVGGVSEVVTFLLCGQSLYSWWLGKVYCIHQTEQK